MATHVTSTLITPRLSPRLVTLNFDFARGVRANIDILVCECYAEPPETYGHVKMRATAIFPSLQLESKVQTQCMPWVAQ